MRKAKQKPTARRRVASMAKGDDEASRETILADGYSEFLASVKERVQLAQLKAALAANAELIRLYWDIGRGILDRQKKLGWGAKVIDRLAADLRHSFPDMKGFSPRNLKYMRAFADA